MQAWMNPCWLVYFRFHFVSGHVCDTCSVSISAAALLALRRPNFTYMLYNKQHYRRYRQSHWKGTLDIVSLMFVLLQGCAWN